MDVVLFVVGVVAAFAAGWIGNGLALSRFRAARSASIPPALAQEAAAAVRACQESAKDRGVRSSWEHRTSRGQPDGPGALVVTWQPWTPSGMAFQAFFDAHLEPAVIGSLMRRLGEPEAVEEVEEA